MLDILPVMRPLAIYGRLLRALATSRPAAGESGALGFLFANYSFVLKLGRHLSRHRRRAEWCWQGTFTAWPGKGRQTEQTTRYRRLPLSNT